MDTSGLARYLEEEQRLARRLDDLRARTESLIAAIDAKAPAATDADELERLLREREKAFQEQIEHGRILAAQIRSIEEENRRAAAMAERRAAKRAAPPRSQAEIEKLSGELTTKLRLDRVDDAIKELLDFLADDPFFAENATTGRKRRLRTLHTTLGKALS